MRVNRSLLVTFLWQQVIYLAIAAVVAAVFWTIGQAINPATIILYSLVFGNAITPGMLFFADFYGSRPFPLNWGLFLLILCLLVTPAYIIASVVVWWLAPPSPQTLAHLITTGWKFPALVVLVYSTVSFLYRTTRDRLELRNRELQQRVEQGTAKLEVQKQELERAREIQQSLLPRQIPQLPGFEVAAAWRPARTVSGDYFDVFRLGEHKMAICIADVVGKGVSAALLMANVQAAVRAYADQSVNPAELCVRVNRLLCENIATGKFVTCLFGVLDCQTKAFAYCNAGHLPPILVSEGAARSLDHGGAVLGVFPDWKYECNVLQLLPGDRLLLFTDGITEASGPDGVEFEDTRIGACVLRNCTRKAAEINAALLAEVETYCCDQFQDDATLLVVAAQ